MLHSKQEIVDEIDRRIKEREGALCVDSDYDTTKKVRAQRSELMSLREAIFATDEPDLPEARFV